MKVDFFHPHCPYTRTLATSEKTKPKMNLSDVEINKWLEAMEFDNVSSVSYVKKNILQIIKLIGEGETLKLTDQNKEINNISDFQIWLNRYNEFAYFKVSELLKQK